MRIGTTYSYLMIYCDIVTYYGVRVHNGTAAPVLENKSATDRHGLRHVGPEENYQFPNHSEATKPN